METEFDEEKKVNEKKKIKHTRKINPKKIVFISIIALVFLFIIIYLLLVPRISLNGSKKVTIEYGESFEEPGFKATYLGKDITDKAWIEGTVDDKVLGEYKLKYKVRKNKITITKERTVKIVDTVKPVITLNGEQDTKICPNTIYKEEGYTAVDNYDGDITKNVKVTRKEDQMIYTVSDSSNNKKTVIRTIEKKDVNAPIITLKGGENYYVTQNGKYKDPGYTAEDECEGDLTSRVTVKGTVNTKEVGTYELEYSVEDSMKNKAVVKRTIYVTKEIATSDPIKGTIYLTFDDGPSATITPKVLKILKEKNVKATFFVINHSDNLNYLIKQEYDEGHTVALHSMTHNYSKVYSSVDAYFKDLEAIRDKVQSITGESPTIIRFPGGSSNTVSRHYSKGIMKTLTREVINKGYHYFDWNVSSGDAGEAKTSSDVYRNVTKGLSKSRANVILMHDFESNYKTLNALSDIIDYGKANGYEFLAIDMSTAMVRHSVNN